jgi:hypothetical protein
MTWIATGIAVAGTLYSAHQTNQGAKAAAGQANVAGHSAISESAMNEALGNLEADNQMAQARAEADTIKAQAYRMRGQIVVAQSGSGAMIGEGSAQAAMDQLDALSSADALAALYSGVNRAASTRANGRFGRQAGMERAKGFGAQASSQLAAGNAAMVGGLLSAGSQVAKGYAKSQEK